MTTVVEARFPYQFDEEDGTSIKIIEGDRFLLIEKATEDWWKVQRLDDLIAKSPTSNNGIYVPAAYMHEVTKSVNQYEDERGSENSSGSAKISSLSPKERDYMNLDTYRSMINFGSGDPRISDVQTVIAPPVKEVTGSAEVPSYVNISSANTFGTGTWMADITGRKTLSPRSPVENGEKLAGLPSKTSEKSGQSSSERDGDLLHPNSYGIPEECENLDSIEKREKAILSRSFDGRDSTNVYDQPGMTIRGDTLSSVSSTSDRKSWTLPAGGLPSEWKKITDSSSGRSYYFNERTQESVWKPPRFSMYFDQKSDDDDDDDYNENDETFESDYDAPPGWIFELDEDSNEAIYTNSVTQEKWKSCKDESGQTYYYQINGDITAWELPSVEVQYRNLRRRSLDDVLEEKRLSQASMFNRNSKCKSVLIDTPNSSFQHPSALPPGSSSPANHRRSRSALAYETLNASTPDLHTAPLTILEGKKVNIVEREGLLFRRKTAEGGKPIKRSNWQQCYVVKYGSTLVFYKDQKSAAPRPGCPNGKPESSLDLRGAALEHVPKDKSRGKKHVFQIVTYGRGTTIQLFADNVQSMGRWITCIQTTIKRLEEEDPLLAGRVESEERRAEVDGAGSPGVLTTPQQAQQSPPTSATLAPPLGSRSRGASGEKGFRGFSRRLSKRGQLVSDKDEDKEKTKIKDKLKKFMARRPSYSELEKKGIIKEQVFGSNLARLCTRENTTVPKFVSTCIRIIEEKGLNTDGIYRVCGNVSMVQKLRILTDQEEPIHFSDHQWDDVHIFTGTLKLYFRELPEPLFPYELFDQFVEAIRKPTKQEKLRCCKLLVSKLPTPNHDTIVALFKHLRRVIERSAKNRMQSQNISIVFGPTLLRPEHEHSNMAMNMVYQNQIVDFMLQEFDNIFVKK